MISFLQFRNGLVRYLDSEMITKITGWKKWVAGVSIAMAMDNGTELFNQLKENPIVKAMAVIDEEDNIDIESLYKYFSAEAKKSSITFDAPIVGTITLKASDIDKLYSFMKE